MTTPPPTNKKVVGDNGINVFRDWAESQIDEKTKRSATMDSKVDALSNKPLNGAGLAVLRDWVLAKIASIPVGPDLDEVTEDATATSGDILSGKTAYAKGSKITGTIAIKSASNLTASGATVSVPTGYYPATVSKSVSTATQAIPSVSINNSTGLVTVSATQTAGYVSAGTKSGTLQLTTQAAQTIIPGTITKTISANRWLTGDQTISGDANLIAANIKKGASIFGVKGSVDQSIGDMFRYWENATFSTSGSSGAKSVYANGIFLINFSSEIAYSTDGKNWNKTTISPTESMAKFIVYGNGAFVIPTVGSPGSTVLYSANGIDWASITLPAYGDRRSMIYANELFVALPRSSNSNHNQAIYSTDGKNWTSVNLSTSSYYWEYLIYANGIFLGGSPMSTRQMLYSTDGKTWTIVTLPAGGPFTETVYGNGVFVRLPASSHSTAIYSTNGKTWTTVTLPLAYDWDDIVYGNGVFISKNMRNSTIIRSIDGTTWEAVIVNTGSSTLSGSCTYVDGAFLLSTGSKMFFSVYGKHWSSTDCQLSNYNIEAVCANGITIVNTNSSIAYSTYM